MDKKQADQRKTLVFRILDDLKDKGERVNADKVARLAQMGKQTVLPYYNQWRFLDQAEKDEDADLPSELTRALKRMLVQWKQEVSEELLNFKEKTDHEIAELTKKNQALTEQNQQLQSALDEERKVQASLQRSYDDKCDQFQEKKLDITALEARLESFKDNLAAFKQENKALTESHKVALVEQEEKLDGRCQAQIDHWMKVVDEERQHKNSLSKELEKFNQELLTSKKENAGLQARVEQKSQAFLEACEERNALREAEKKVAPALKLNSQMLFMMGSDQAGCLERVKTLLVYEQQRTGLEEKNSALGEHKQRLESELQKVNKKLESTRGMELELEKSKGYIAALEKSFNQMADKDK